MTADTADRGQDELWPKPAPRPDQTAYWDEWERSVEQLCERVEACARGLEEGTKP